MKNLVFTLVFLVVCVTGVSQVFMPQAIPCLHINEYQELNEDVITHECLIIDGVNIPIDFPANEIELKSGGSIEVFPLTTFEPDASRIELLIEEPEFDVAWFEPAIVGEVPKFEKLEIGLTLPQDVQLLVDQFLEDSDIIPNLNPFNPEDIDIYAEFSRRLSPGVWTESKRINAFYFEEYERDVSGNTEDWHWDEVDSDYCFRVRYAPKEAGFVRCVIHCVIDGLEVQKSKFEFNVVESANPGFVEVGPTGKYLQYADGELFFPIGQNMILPKYLSRIPGFDLDEDCDGTIDVWNHTPEVPPTPTGNYSNMDYDSRAFPYPPGAYEDNDLAIIDFYNSGANYFKVMCRPQTWGLEYEKLNDYSDRLHMAWEFDKMLKLIKPLDLKMHWCIQSQYEFVTGGDGETHWDWPGSYDVDGNVEDRGNCYHMELGIENAEDFLSDEVAIEIYKRKIRYLIARWGYSTEIAVIELFSEINDIGDGGEGGNVYKNDVNIQQDVEDWHKEMAEYIKLELGHTDHLLSTQYLTGGPISDYQPVGEYIIYTDLTSGQTFLDLGNLIDVANNTYGLNEIPWPPYSLSSPPPYSADPYVEWSSESWDDSYTLSAIDLNCESRYKLGANRFYENASRFQDKPFMFSEIGPGKGTKCDGFTSHISEMMMSPFIGCAGMALNWDNMWRLERDHWDYFGYIKDFMNGLDLNISQWTPGNISREDDLASLVYLKTGAQSENNVRIVGAVMNETFNGYSYKDCSYLTDDPFNYKCNDDDECECESEDFLDNYFQTGLGSFLTVPESFDTDQILKIDVSNQANDEYIIVYYNPFEGQYLFNGLEHEFETDESGDLHIPYPDLTAEMPIVYFEIFDSNMNGVKSIQIGNNNDEISSSQYNAFREEQFVDVSGPNNFSVWPNPSTGIIQIEYPESEVFQTLTIFDVSGREVFSTSEKRTEIDLSNLERGPYLIVLKTNLGSLTKKIQLL